jgi:hypothetical protein
VSSHAWLTTFPGLTHEPIKPIWVIGLFIFAF